MMRAASQIKTLTGSVSRAALTSVRCLDSTSGRRTTTNTAESTKSTGDISSVFPSLSGAPASPLPPRFAALKERLIRGHEDAIEESWHQLLKELRQEIAIIREAGSSIIPEISFSDIKYDNVPKMTHFRDQLKKHGVAVIRGVVTEKEALDWKALIKRYIQDNPTVKGFPPNAPAVYELYWSASQILARANPDLLKAQKFLMSHWHSTSPSALISTSHPVTYADRLRIRPPGDTGFALGPHMDGGSVERWEENGYGGGQDGGVYASIFNGQYQNYDPWESSSRLDISTDNYHSPGGCSVFRMFQGWLALSPAAATQGHLLTFPLPKLATAYLLLRPFFSSRAPPPTNGDLDSYLSPSKWPLSPMPLTSNLPGASPSSSQELHPDLHPHLHLPSSMVPMPPVRPGDYVAWHPDTIHAVDAQQTSQEDSSVMYIPACPLTEANAKYLVRQREAFWDGKVPPDFPDSGEGEKDFMGRLDPDFVMEEIGDEGASGMGLRAWDVPASRRGEGQDLESGRAGEGWRNRERRMLERANEILGF